MSWPRITGLLCFVLLASSLYGQIAGGSLRDLVQDSTEARIAGASIQMRLPESALVRRTSSDGHGEFLLEGLPSGRYEITVSARDFATASAEIVML